MKVNRVFIVLLAIFMISVSVGLAFADDMDDNATDTNSSDDEPLENETDGEMVIEDVGVINGTRPDYPADANITTSYTLANKSSDSANASGANDTNHTVMPVKDKHATGNPLLVLMVAVAGLGLYPLRRRK